MRHVTYCFALLLAAGSAFGQAGGTGSIQGTVTDPSGAVVGGAAVTASNLSTGVRTERKTTDAGFFVLSLLPPGEYTVTVNAPGFQSLVRARVVVDALDQEKWGDAAKNLVRLSETAPGTDLEIGALYAAATVYNDQLNDTALALTTLQREMKVINGQLETSQDPDRNGRLQSQLKMVQVRILSLGGDQPVGTE